MSKAQFEIFNQYESLLRTRNYLKESRDAVLKIIEKYNNFVFLGCGSSFYIAKSGAAIAAMYGAGKSSAIAAGDFLVDPDSYIKLVEDSCVFMISRSGRTSEILLVSEILKKKGIKCSIVSICATEKSPMVEFADCNVEIPWAFDESVCQTRTVSNLYTALALIFAERYNDSALLNDFDKLIENGEKFLNDAKEQVTPVTKMNWKNAVVLADGAACGIAEEGALAFNEICMKRSNYYHLLDLRHGPMVLLNKDTLVIMLMSSSEHNLQSALLEDVKKKGAYVVCVSSDDNYPAADMVIGIADYSHTAKGVALLNVIQCITLGLANENGVDPDHPNGLDPWITLC